MAVLFKNTRSQPCSSHKIWICKNGTLIPTRAAARKYGLELALKFKVLVRATHQKNSSWYQLEGVVQLEIQTLNFHLPNKRVPNYLIFRHPRRPS